MLDPLISDDDLFDEIHCRVMTHGIAFDGWACLTPVGISLAGRRLVVVIRRTEWLDDHTDVRTGHE